MVVPRIHQAWLTHSVEEATEAFGSSWRGAHVAEPKEGRFGLRLTHDGDPDLVMTLMDWGSSGAARTSANTFYQVCDFLGTAIEFTVGRESLDTTAAVLIPRQPAESRWDDSYLLHSVQIEQTAVDAFARDYFGRPSLTVAFTGARAITPQAAAIWRSTDRYVRDDVIAESDLFDNDLIWSESRRMLIATLLVTFPNNTLDVRASHDGAVALPASIRRAVAYMEEHLADPISVIDIAQAARLSPRGLQDAFRRITGQSPTQFLRRIRLEAAHDKLTHADTAETSVTEVARSLGFVHVPRFAAAYRAQYGENPSDTLRR